MRIIGLILGIIIGFLVWWIISWASCLFEIMNYDRKYDWCSFDDFQRVFNKTYDDYKLKYGEVFTDINSLGNLYYSYLPSRCSELLWDKRNFMIFKKNEIEICKYYMMLNPVDYLKYRIWLKERTKKMNRIDGLWKEGNDNEFTS